MRILTILNRWPQLQSLRTQTMRKKHIEAERESCQQEVGTCPTRWQWLVMEGRPPCHSVLMSIILTHWQRLKFRGAVKEKVSSLAESGNDDRNFPCASARERNTRKGQRGDICFSCKQSTGREWWLRQLKLQLPGSRRLTQPKQMFSRNFHAVPETQLGVDSFRGSSS